jgi:isopenicillin N synthase-like dioxygenase
VHLVEEAFGIPIGTFDDFFLPLSPSTDGNHAGRNSGFLPPQHRIKLLKYPTTDSEGGQGVGPHKDSSGWLTFLYQVDDEPGLEVFTKDSTWAAAPPVEGTFVVNFGNAFEAATEGAVRATVHRVVAPRNGKDRYSIPFFMGLPLDLRVSEIGEVIPESVKKMRKESDKDDLAISSFLDPRWDSLGESQLRKWIRSHEDVGRKWYGDKTVEYYLS